MAHQDPDTTPRVAITLEHKIAYRFRDQSLLREALRHPTYAEEHPAEGPHNQRLEFLGDAVLSLVLAEELFKHFTRDPASGLTERRAALCNSQFLATLGNELCIGACMQIGRGEDLQGGRTKDKVLEDAFEALIGAVYLDGGLDAVRQVILHIYQGHIFQDAPISDPKGTLINICRPLEVKFEVISQKGPDHSPVFTVVVKINGEIRGYGVGRNKKEAEVEAARQVLSKMM